MLWLDPEEALDYHVLSSHNDTIFKVANDLPKSALGSMILK